MRLPWVLYGFPYAVLLVAWLIALRQLRQFLGAVTAIGDDATLRSYKSLVRLQMYLALVGIACMLAGLLVGLTLILTHGLKGLAVVLLTQLVVLLLGLYLKKAEERARGLTATPELAAEYGRVSQVWLHKPLPNF